MKEDLLEESALPQEIKDNLKKLNKKYLIAHGCSFTEGHNLGKDGAWPKFLGEEEIKSLKV